LVQQSDLDGPPTGFQSLPELVCGDLQRVNAQFFVHQLNDLFPVHQSYSAKAAAIPKKQLIARPTRETQPQPQVSLVRWVGEQYQSGHPWLDHQVVISFELNHHTFSAASDLHDLLIAKPPIHRIDAGFEQDWAQRARGLFG
jgi:hypothetical protein